jgi:hypothetical protein
MLWLPYSMAIDEDRLTQFAILGLYALVSWASEKKDFSKRGLL